MKRRTIEGECAMTLSQLLDIRPGVTAVIGGGGKTTLLRTLGEELARTASGPAVHHHQDSPVFGPALRPDRGGAGRTAQGASAAVCRDRRTGNG